MKIRIEECWIFHNNDEVELSWFIIRLCFISFLKTIFHDFPLISAVKIFCFAIILFEIHIRLRLVS